MPAELFVAWLPAEPPSLERFLAPDLQPLPILPALAVVLAVGYLTGAVSLWLRGHRWSITRTISFVAGTVLLAVVMGAGVEGYGYLMFSVFMFQQLTLMIAVPPLLVLGSPFRLMLRAVPHHGPGRIVLRCAVGLIYSRPFRWLLHPAAGIPLFLVAYYGLYLSDVGSRLLGSWWGHNLLEITFLISGVIFTIPILTSGPGPIHPSFLGRLVDMFVEMALHAFFGVLIMMSPGLIIDAFSTPPPAWGLDPLADQQTAGGLAWAYGEGPATLIVVYLVFLWFFDDTAKARRRDRDADRTGDAELAAYNDQLAQLTRAVEARKRTPDQKPQG